MHESSRGLWESKGTIEHINTGSLQRIADACEKMAASYDAMRNDRDMYQRLYKNAERNIGQLERSNAALRGVITKMRKAQEQMAFHIRALKSKEPK